MDTNRGGTPLSNRRAALGVAASALLVSAPVAAETIRIDLHVAAPAAQVWDAVRDYGAVHRRLARGFVTDTQVSGNVRTVRFANGLVVAELVLGVDDGLRRIAYSAQGSPDGFHAASMEVLEEGAESRIVWTADVLPEERARAVRGMMEQGALAMKQTLEADAAAAGTAP